MRPVNLVVNRVNITLVSVICLALLVAGPGSAQSERKAASTLLADVNATRAHYGLRPLHLDSALERAAQSHSVEMLHSGTFTHGAFAARIRRFGVRVPLIGENLAWGTGPYAQAWRIVQEWLASPEHRANLLRPGFSRIGIGAAWGTFQGYAGALVVTADFGGR